MVEVIVRQILNLKNIDQLFNVSRVFVDEFYFKACNTHIFGNSFPSFVPDVIKERGMHRGDHVHVFMDKEYEPIKMNAFVSAMLKCYMITGRKIIIHIPAYYSKKSFTEKFIKALINQKRINDNQYRDLKYDIITMRKPIRFVYKFKGWPDRFDVTKYIEVYIHEESIAATRSNRL